MKFLFLKENKQKYKLFKIKKYNIHNYFIDALKCRIIKSINIIGKDNILNNSFNNINNNSINIHSENRYLNYKTEKLN